MPTYTYIVRIELHGQLANYTQLHQWMYDQGFRTTITADSGAAYQPPTATYEIISERTTDSLRNWLIDNLPIFGSNPGPWILVVKSAGAAWSMDNPLKRAA